MPRPAWLIPFDPNASDAVFSIAVQADGKILAGGVFTGANSIGGQTRNRIARLDATTGLADSFNPNANFTVFSVAVQTDGKILAGGHFSSIGGQTRNHIARLDATTGLADSFDPNAKRGCQFNRGAGGRQDFGGRHFHEHRRTAAQPHRPARCHDRLADSFNPNANNGVDSIAVQADGKILAGGISPKASADSRAITSPGSMPRPGWPIHSTRTRTIAVHSIAVQADGKILAGGAFTSIGGQPRSHFARLSNDTAALQNLAVTQTTITWTRGGSSPQFTRVTFEYSTDNVNYTPLGNGTAAAATGP